MAQETTRALAGLARANEIFNQCLESRTPQHAAAAGPQGGWPNSRVSLARLYSHELDGYTNATLPLDAVSTALGIMASLAVLGSHFLIWRTTLGGGEQEKRSQNQRSGR